MYYRYRNEDSERQHFDFQIVIFGNESWSFVYLNVGDYYLSKLSVMIHEQRIEIGLNKKKLSNGLITCTCLAIIGLILTIPTNNNYLTLNNQFVKYGVAGISILIFSFGIFYFLRKLIDKKPGILIDDKGIYDNSSAVSVGLISWNNVTELAKAKSMKQEFLIIKVNNLEYYINKQTNFLMKKGMMYNNKYFGSPLAISANLLNCNLNELISILEKRLLNRQP